MQNFNMGKFKYITFPITNNEDADHHVHVYRLFFTFAVSMKQNQDFGDEARNLRLTLIDSDSYSLFRNRLNSFSYVTIYFCFIQILIGQDRSLE